MGCREANSSLSSLAVNKISKGNFYTEKPVFCENGTSLIISSGKSLHLYCISTGNHIKELLQCADDIISYQLHPFEPSLVIAITENGQLIAFNLKTNEIEYSIQLSLSTKILKKQNPPKFNSEDENGDEDFNWETQPLDSLSYRKFIYAEVKSFQNSSTDIFVWASWSLNSELRSHLSVFSLNSGKHIGLLHLRKTGLKKCYQNFVVGTTQNLDILVGMSINFVHIASFDIKKKNYYKKHYIGHNIKLTCLAIHPTECIFATGDSFGRITIWRNVFENHPLKDVFHWHTLPVRDLYFSKFGNYLFSGGEENVLVKWSLSSRNKDFLPRLSSAIYHISGAPESSLLSVSTMDNKILIINFNFQNISTIQHFSRWSVLKGNSKPNIFSIDPRSNCLVLNGKTGHIQFLSLSEEGKFIYTFDVTNRNFVTSNSNFTIENTEVTHAKFNKWGKWLVTAENRSLKEFRLKFWMYCEKEGSYMLNTNIELPHEDACIYSLEISPDDKVATTGADKKFRLWSIFECQLTNRTKEIWALHSVNKYRNFSCFAIDFSKDASLIAISFGSVLTIWETDSCELKCSLSTPNKKDDLKFCKFGNNELSHLVVTGTEMNVSSWNTITLSMLWTVPLKLSFLVSDPFSIYMAAFSADYSLIIFNPSTPSPDFLFKKISYFPVVAAHCTLSENGRFCLYFLTSNQDLFCMEDKEKVVSATCDNASNSFLTPYSGQLAQIYNRPESQKGKISLNKSNNQLVSNLLNSPAHTLPNPSLLCSDILKGLLVFSNCQPSKVSTLKSSENIGAGVSAKTSKNSANVISDETEAKLLNLVQTIFI